MPYPLPFSIPSALRLFIWLIMATLFYYINIRMPMIGDDYLYSVIYEYKEESPLSERYTSQLIETLPQFLHSCWGHYLGTNGRFSDVIGSFLLSLGGGKDCFNILNTVVFLLFIGLATYYFFGKTSASSLLCTTGIVLLCIPIPEGTLLWTMGAVNYLWGSLLLIGILCYIRRLQHQKVSTGWQIAGCLCAFLAARHHEGIAIPMAAACFTTLLFCRQSRTRAFILFTLFISLGAMITISSPAIWKRAASNSCGPFMNIILSLTGYIRHSLFPIAITGFILLTHRKRILEGFRKPRMEMLFLGSLFFFLVGLTSLYGNKGIWGGAYYYVNLVMAFLILSFLGKSWLTKGRSYRISMGTIGTLFFLFFYAQLARDAELGHELHQQALSQAKAGQTTCVVTCPEYGNIFINGRCPDTSPGTLYCRAAAAVWKVNPYYLVLKRPGIDESAYDSFNNRPANSPQTAASGTSIIVRMPKGIFPQETIDGRKETILEDIWVPRHSQLLRLARKIVKGDIPPGYTRDYYGGFHYLIFPASAYARASLSIKGIDEQSLEETEFCLDLP